MRNCREQRAEGSQGRTVPSGDQRACEPVGYTDTQHVRARACVDALDAWQLSLRSPPSLMWVG